MANKYYDGSEKESNGGKKSQTSKSVARKVVDVLGSVAGIGLLVFGVSKGISKGNNKA